MMRVLLAIIAMVLLLFGAILAIDGCSSGSGSGGNREQAPEPEVTTEIIVARLQEIQELASLRISASGIVHGSQPGRRFYHGTSRMVLLVRGEAIYSVDLAELRIAFTPNQLEISLPPPAVTAAWVDVERTRIWSRERGRFRENFSERLEQACWEAAQQLILQSANRSQHRTAAAATIEALITRVVRDIDPDMLIDIRWRS